MNEVARVYAESLFEAARNVDKLDAIHTQLGEFADAVREQEELEVFFMGPHLSAEEKKKGLDQAVSDAEPELVNFLELLVENQRMAQLHRIREQFDERWRAENRILGVTVTSAVELDDDVLDRIREAVEEETDQTVELSHRVDESIIGGLVLRVGNMVLDSSIRNRLQRFREQVSAA